MVDSAKNRTNNPILGVLDLLPSDSIANRKIDRITLEIVERNLFYRLKLAAININKLIDADYTVLPERQFKTQSDDKLKFPSKEVLTFLANSIKFSKGSIDFDQTQRVKLSRELFSHTWSADLLF